MSGQLPKTGPAKEHIEDCRLKIEDLWMSLRSVIFVIFFIIASPQADLKSSIINLHSSISLNLSRNRFSQFGRIGFGGLDILYDATIKKNQDPIRHHEDFIELRG